MLKLKEEESIKSYFGSLNILTVSLPYSIYNETINLVKKRKQI